MIVSMLKLQILYLILIYSMIGWQVEATSAVRRHFNINGGARSRAGYKLYTDK